MSPAYDVTHAHNPQGEWTSQHLMGVGGTFSGITRAGLLAVANRFGIGSAPKVLKQVAEAVAAWPEFADRAGVSGAESKLILSHHRLL